MTERQRRFVTEYIKDGNATQAAKRAGFSAKTAGSIGGRLLKNVVIAQAIEAIRGPAVDEAHVTLTGHLLKLAELRDAAIKAGQLGPAVKAEESRGKCAGFYTERVSLTVAPGTGVLSVPVLGLSEWSDAAVAQQADLLAAPSFVPPPPDLLS